MVDPTSTAAIDDLHRCFTVTVNEGFLLDMIEHLTHNWYLVLDDRFVSVALNQKRWDLVVLELCALSGYDRCDPLVLDAVYNHSGSIVAHYSTPKLVSVGPTFRTVLPIAFVSKFFELESGDVSYYHHGSYVYQIHPKWNEQETA